LLLDYCKIRIFAKIIGRMIIIIIRIRISSGGRNAKN